MFTEDAVYYVRRLTKPATLLKKRPQLSPWPFTIRKKTKTVTWVEVQT